MSDDQFGTYTLLKHLGRGGYAEVWKARQARPKRIVALKILRNDLWEPGEAQARFEREADAAGGLFHPHIATVLAIGEANGRPYIAMQYIAGLPLDEVLKKRAALPWHETLRILEQVVSALDCAHEAGLIHRDVKPANIILGEKEGAVLTDFGLVRAINLASQSVDDPSTGQVGTPHYKPRELWLGEKKTGSPTPATDVYSLACVLVEMLSGEVLFKGDSIDEVIAAHLMLPPELPQHWPTGAPPGLGDVIARALAKEMGERYPTAGAFLAAIQALIGAEQTRQAEAERQQRETDARKKQAEEDAAQQAALQAAVRQAEEKTRRQTETRMRAESDAKLAAAHEQAEIKIAEARQQAEKLARDAAAKADALRRQSQVAPQGEKQILTLAPGVELELVRVPAGPFLMGSDKAKDKDAYDADLPQHEVHLDEYWIGITPVTVAQFTAFVKATSYQTTAEKEGGGWTYTGEKWDYVKGADWQHPRGPKSDVRQKQDHPVTLVSWDDAAAFCEWASRAGAGFEPALTVRLPSEAEWEKAARGGLPSPRVGRGAGGEGRLYPWGDAPPDKTLCNFNMNAKDTTPVGKYSPGGDSPYGCADMAGNVWEWTRSLWKSYPYDPKDGREDPDSRDRRVLRGGSFNYDPRLVRCASRYWYFPNDRVDVNGFRVVAFPI